MYISTYLFVHSIGSRKRNRKARFANQIDKPNTETIAYMDLFSQRTVHEPSVVLSQKHELAVCKPAPFFCIITHETMYLNGLFNLVNELRIASTMFDVHVLILAC